MSQRVVAENHWIPEQEAPNQDSYENWMPKCGDQNCRGMFLDMRGDLRATRKQNFEQSQEMARLLSELSDAQRELAVLKQRTESFDTDKQYLARKVEDEKSETSKIRNQLVDAQLEVEAVGKGIAKFMAILGAHAQTSC